MSVRSCYDKNMDELLKLGRKSIYRKGEILVRPQDIGRELFIVVTGVLHAYTIENSGDKNVQIIYGEGDIFPIAVIAKKSLHNVYYEALSECEVVRLEVEKLLGLLQSDAGLAFDVLNQVVGQFIQYKARVDNLEYKYVRERIAYQLLFLGRKFGEVKDGIVTMHRFGQDEIGSTTNVGRESVSRELKRFQRLNYIAYEGGKLKLTNVAALRKELAMPESPLFIDDM